MEATLRGAVGGWKVAPSSGDKPGLVLVSARAFPALEPGAAPEREALEAFAIAQVPSERDLDRAYLEAQLVGAGEVPLQLRERRALDARRLFYFREFPTYSERAVHCSLSVETSRLIS